VLALTVVTSLAHARRETAAAAAEQGEVA
jgi:hypothetical protein